MTNMEMENETLFDLSIFNREGGDSVFDKINNCLTTRGSDQLRINLLRRLPSTEEILEVQHTLQKIESASSLWPAYISNGTIMVLEKFLEATIDPLPAVIHPVNAYAYKLLHNPDYSLIKYSIPHCIAFLRGINDICSILKSDNPSRLLQAVLDETGRLLEKEPLKGLTEYETTHIWNPAKLLEVAYRIRYSGKASMEQLLNLFGKLDAWYGMAMAAVKWELRYPQFSENNHPCLKAEGLYHLLLKDAVPYDLELGGEKNMLFLTGANMAGKSTFIRSVGAAVHLAHTGMAVPARSMNLIFFDGLISNINIRDDISKGESYFYNEVMRIRDTVIKISDKRKWLVLIDELFKGTNVEDAMKCSLAVIEGLLQAKNCIFIISTHLYELGASLQRHSNIDFRYFETSMQGDEFSFSYRLQKGISNDRLGYLILTREGLLNLLQRLG